MSNFIAWLANLFAPVVAEAEAIGTEIEQDIVSVPTKLVAAFGGVIGLLEAGEQQDLHDAMAQFSADVKAGKGMGEAAADALSVFFNESKGTVSAAAKSLFTAFLNSVGVSSTPAAS